MNLGFGKRQKVRAVPTNGPERSLSPGLSPSSITVLEFPSFFTPPSLPQDRQTAW
jgi:hypothetical protein